jgi:hypothetical protein
MIYLEAEKTFLQSFQIASMAKIVADDVLLATIQLTFLPAFKLWWLSICQPGVISDNINEAYALCPESNIKARRRHHFHPQEIYNYHVADELFFSSPNYSLKSRPRSSNYCMQTCETQQQEHALPGSHQPTARTPLAINAPPPVSTSAS